MFSLNGYQLTRYSRWALLACTFLTFGFVGPEHPPHQTADAEWQPQVLSPKYEKSKGPVVRVDAAHGNWHTINARFAAFAKLLRLDGYQVASSGQKISKEMLSDTDIFVIANAIKGGEYAEWKLPTPSAFETGEVEALEDWVREGGSLLLIADHMPFPGSAAQVANAFGIIFYNGYARKSFDGSGHLTFDPDNGLLAAHTITYGPETVDPVTSVRTFTGQAFRAVVPVKPILIMPDNWHVYLPQDSHDRTAETPKVSTRGLLQGAVLQHGLGRVAVFGEAAMFTAQSRVIDGKVRRTGMNYPDAKQNAQFVLNVMHWLSAAQEN